MIKQLKCPYCKDSWLFVSKYDYGSDYENKGYQGSCKCGRFNKIVNWHKTKEPAIEEWNNIIEIEAKMGKYIIELDDDIVKGIRGENDCEVEPREIVRSFQATIADAIKNATPYRSIEDAGLLKRIEDIQEASAKLDRRLNAFISCLYPTCLSKDDVGFIDSQELADNEDK